MIPAPETVTAGDAASAVSMSKWIRKLLMYPRRGPLISPAHRWTSSAYGGMVRSRSPASTVDTSRRGEITGAEANGATVEEEGALDDGSAASVRVLSPDP